MIKLVAFDLDGTIADTIPMCIEAFQKAVSPYVGHTLSENEIIQTFGLNEIGMVKAVVKSRWADALEDFYFYYKELHYKCDKPFDGIVEIMNGLKHNGIIVCLITGKGKKSCEISLEKLKIAHLFSEIMTGSEIKNCKGESLIALKDKYHLLSDECLYIGDAISDVVMSNEVGIKCISAAWSKTVDVAKLNEVNSGNVCTSIVQLKDVLKIFLNQ